MLQRIQTLLLLAESVLLSSLLFSKMAYSTSEVIKFTQITPFLVLSIITTSVAFISIFLYRKRMFQIRMCILNSILLLCFQGWILYYYVIAPEGTVFSITSVFPVLGAIMSLLAMRYIASDEALVRSVSRLRK